MKNTTLESIAFQLISNVGTAKSLVMEALYETKKGNFNQADEKLKESKKYFTEAHKVHSSLIQKEAAGEKIEINLLIAHAEDQLMSTETMTELVKELIEIYQLINKNQ